MKGCAKFLNFIAFIGFLFLVLLTVIVCAGTAVIGLKPDLIPAEAYEALEAITISGKPLTMELLSDYRVPCLIMLGGIILSMILTLVMIAKIRTALREVGHEEPFSVVCSKALNAAAILAVITGLLDIAVNIYSAYILQGMALDGDNIVHLTANLSFIIVAIFLKMLSSISEYGRR